MMQQKSKQIKYKYPIKYSYKYERSVLFAEIVMREKPTKLPIVFAIHPSQTYSLLQFCAIRNECVVSFCVTLIWFFRFVSVFFFSSIKSCSSIHFYYLCVAERDVKYSKCSWYEIRRKRSVLTYSVIVAKLVFVFVVLVCFTSFEWPI